MDAAHIIPDVEGEYGATVVPNGLALSKVHHAAFDGCLIGIDLDLRVHVSERLLDLHDGPILELGIKGMDGNRIWTPRDVEGSPTGSAGLGDLSGRADLRDG